MATAAHPPLAWEMTSRAQHRSTGRRFAVWTVGTGGFRLKDHATGAWYGPFSKLNAAKAKADQIVNAEAAVAPARRGR